MPALFGLERDPTDFKVGAVPKPLELEFGHRPEILRSWRQCIEMALDRGAATPFYLVRSEPIQASLRELESQPFGFPTRHWFSCKTQPAAPVLRWWRGQNRPIEVVSEFEFRAALREGFPATSILVNGPAKHRWLPRVSIPGIRVHFDSMNELKALESQARAHQWKLGLRLRTRGEMDPENPDRPTQFGMDPSEFQVAVRRLQRLGLPLETLSFHLRTNVPSPDFYQAALQEAAEVCEAARFRPRHLDCGGGLPPPHVLMRRGIRYDARMSLQELASMYRRQRHRWPSVEELWLENGRFLFAGSGALAIRVLDIKERGGLRQLICDGGRTLHALISTWEHHELIPLVPRRGTKIRTVVHGPTCMAFDQLAYRQLPKGIRIGDVLIWLEAGAYHLPWETHFCHGLAQVWWEDDAGLQLARDAESFEAYWGRWR